MTQETQQSSASLRILIVTDNFYIGGRETYIESYLSALKAKQVVEVFLLASRVNNPSADSIFDGVYCLKNDSKVNINTLLKLGCHVIERHKFDLVWVHHYNLLAAFLLSSVYRLPLLTTLHGSLIHQGRFVSFNDRLGLSCALHYSSIFSVVSNEIKSEVSDLVKRSNMASLDVKIIPNAVVCDQKMLNQRRFDTQMPVNVVLLTRPQKLDHIRAAILFFNTFCEKFPNSTFTIYCGVELNKSFLGMRLWQFLGRKWLLKNTHILKSLSRISLHPMVNNSYDVIKHADIVMGMGRVALESLAQHKPTVLVGYNNVIDLVDEGNFLELGETNFSGRSQTVTSEKEILNKLISVLTKHQKINIPLGLIDIDSQTNYLLDTIQSTIKNSTDDSMSLNSLVQKECCQLMKEEMPLSDMTFNDIAPNLSRIVNPVLNNVRKLDQLG